MPRTPCFFSGLPVIPFAVAVRALGAAIADGSIGAFKLAGNAVWGGQGGTLLDNSVSGVDFARLGALSAKDGTRDVRIDGGSGTDKASRDRTDPAPDSVP